MIDRKERLEELAKLEDNWDSNNAPAICPEIIAFLKTVLPYLKNWYIFPALNGTILLQIDNKPKTAGISVGKDNYSFVALDLDKKEKRLDSGILKLSKVSIIETLNYLETLVL